MAIPTRPWTGSRAYVSLRPLASGGMGTVELALREEGEFSRVVAVKRLHAQFRQDEELLAMFVDEARLAGTIRHANVVSVLDVGRDDQGPFFVMDYVEGFSLSKILKHHAARSELMPIQVCARIAKQVADGLHAAHEARGPDGTLLELVHRDVSPQNVLVGFDGVVRLVDFGVAKALGSSSQTGVGILKGKFGYMSPEQLRFETPDRRSDLFALGVLLHEMLSGTRLYGGNAEQAARRILVEPPPDPDETRPDVPLELVELSFELLCKDRTQRPEDAHRVARRLEEVTAQQVAHEGSIDVAEYLRQTFEAEILESRASLAGAIADRSKVTTKSGVTMPTDDEPPTRIDAVPGRFGRTVWRVGLACAVIALGAAGWASQRNPAYTAALVPVTKSMHVATLPPAASATPSAISSVLAAPAESVHAAPGRRPSTKKPGSAGAMPVWHW